MTETETTARPVFGWMGFAIGAVALLMALVVFWAGPFAPQQSAGVSLGELAAEISKSAARSAMGLAQPEPQAPVRDLDDHLQIAVAVLGGLAIVLAATGFVRHEGRRPAIAGATLGVFAIVFQFFAWYALALLGVLAIMALLNSLGGVFEGIFG